MRKTTADTKKPPTEAVKMESNIAGDDCVVIQSEVMDSEKLVDLDISKDIFNDWRDDLGIKTSFKFEARDSKQQITKNQKRAFYGNQEYKKRSQELTTHSSKMLAAQDQILKESMENLKELQTRASSRKMKRSAYETTNLLNRNMHKGAININTDYGVYI